MTQVRQQIAILFGGRSVEHDISIRSASNVVRYLDPERFEATLLGISKAGAWFRCADINQPITHGVAINMVMQEGKWAFAERQSGALLPDFDLVFPVLHGTDGEDGSIQGLLKAASLPFIGCGVLSSAMAMSKLITKQMLAAAGVNIGRYHHYRKAGRADINFHGLLLELGLPMIVKPVNLGSSVGVHKVTDQASFDAALADAFTYDDEILIEEFIEGREMECAVLGNAHARASQAGEIIVKGHDFYSFEAKYVDAAGASIVIPAPADDKLLKEIQEQTLLAYRALHCEDLARIDLFVTDEGKVYINEINTIPGFTDISMYPKLWELEDISYQALLSQLADHALARYQEKQNLDTNFISALS